MVVPFAGATLGCLLWPSVIYAVIRFDGTCKEFGLSFVSGVCATRQHVPALLCLWVGLGSPIGRLIVMVWHHGRRCEGVLLEAVWLVKVLG